MEAKSKTEVPTKTTSTLPTDPAHRANVLYQGGQITGASPYQFTKEGKIIEVRAGFKATGLRTYDGKTALPQDFIAAIIDAYNNDKDFRAIYEIMKAANTRKA